LVKDFVITAEIHQLAGMTPINIFLTDAMNEQQREESIRAMQRLIDEALASPSGQRSMTEIRAEAHRRLSSRREE